MNDEEVDFALLALADPTRRALLNRLSAGERCVTELAKPFGISLNAVSKHIRVLERARLVRRRRVWREYRVCIDPARLNEVANWMQTQRAAWIDRLSALDTLLTTEEHQTSKSTPTQEQS